MSTATALQGVAQPKANGTTIIDTWRLDLALAAVLEHELLVLTLLRAAREQGEGLDLIAHGIGSRIATLGGIVLVALGDSNETHHELYSCMYGLTSNDKGGAITGRVAMAGKA